ncbi:hypothetical protein HSBAA_53240 [Vreelandella sulfidaeris]|uniref:Uncharacterized protein n=1 Tax=Vreelandella sulfidaeris TaxID=115553 RepID=A0A455UI60_9GAMM|nr:hypothetical protein HSBAA_53240 [Halomonas sulfidaeris]
MSHYAVIAPPLYSHVKALQALAIQLIERGHQITFVQQFEARPCLTIRVSAFIRWVKRALPRAAWSTLWHLLPVPLAWDFSG